MASFIQKNLVDANKNYAASFTQGDLALPPAKKYLVRKSAKRPTPSASKTNDTVLSVTCMDARIDPAAAYGIDLGDAHVIRNAGGNAKDGLRSILISEHLLGTREIILIKHTGCGMLTFKNEDALGVVTKAQGGDAIESSFDFQPFPDLDQAVRDDVAWLKKHPAIPQGVTISGWVYEVETGKVRSVE